MFCGRCGTQNPDGAVHCYNCGTPLNAAEAKTEAVPGPQGYTAAPGGYGGNPNPGYNGNPNPGYGVNPNAGGYGVNPNPGAYGGAAGYYPAYSPDVTAQVKKKNNNKIIGIVIVVLLVAAAIIIGTKIIGGGSADSVAEDFVVAMFNADVDRIIELLPDELIDAYADEMGVSTGRAKREIKGEFEDALGDMAETMRDIKVTATANGDEEYSKSELKDIKDTYGDIDVPVKDAKIVMVKVKLKYEGESVTLPDDLEVPLIKVGNSWYVDFANMYTLIRQLNNLNF